MSHINHHRSVIATILYASDFFDDYSFARKKINPLSFEHPFHQLIIKTANKYIDAFKEFDIEIMMRVLLKNKAMDEAEWVEIVSKMPLAPKIFETYTQFISRNNRMIKEI